MGNFSINRGGINTNLEGMPSIDLRYGPYPTKQAAIDRLGPNDLDVITEGLTVGIQPTAGAPVVEWWFQPDGQGGLQLVEKQVAPVSDAVLYTEQELNASQQTQARSNIGAGTSNFSGNYNDLTNKPTIPTVPTISTNIDSDATSDTKTASPKAVKTFVEGKGYLTQHQDLSGKVDKVFGATENNFAAFDSDGGIQNSGYSKDSFATAAQGEKADNAIPMPTGGSNEYILAKDSNETAGVKWVEKPTNGKSAYQLYYDAEVDAGRTPLSPEAWLASLKANIGEFKFVTYDSSAESAFTTGGIGTTYSSTIDGLTAGTDTTPDVILLMNNTNGTTAPTKTFMIATQDDGSSNFEFVYVGDLQSAMSSNVLTQANIVNDLTTGGVDDVLSAEQGKKLKKEKLDKDSDSDTFYITDSNNNVICQIDAEGIHSVNYTYKDVTDSLADENGNVSLIAKLTSILIAISEKQDTLTFDNTPTAESNNPVKSGGIKTSLDAKFDKEISDNSLIITDSNGYIICKIDADGVHAPNIQDNGGNIVLNNDSLVVTDPNGYIVFKVDNNGIHSVVDKHAVACMVLSENYYPTQTPTRDGNGNVTHAVVTFYTGVSGTIDITYTNGNASSASVVYGSYTYTITINRDYNGNVTTVSVTEQTE